MTAFRTIPEPDIVAHAWNLSTYLELSAEWDQSRLQPCVYLVRRYLKNKNTPLPNKQKSKAQGANILIYLGCEQFCFCLGLECSLD